MKVTTGSSSGCEKKLAECLERVVGDVDSVDVTMQHLSRGPALVCIIARGLAIQFPVDLSDIRRLEGEAFDKLVKNKIAEAYGDAT